MKNLLKYSMAVLVLATGFTACSDDDDYQTGQWNAAADYADIYFKQASSTLELDPTEETVATFDVYRRVQHEYTWGKDSEGNDSITNDKIVTPLPAITVPMEIVENSGDIFTITDAAFAEGDTVATVTVKFPNAEIGKVYTLKVKVTDPKYASYYSSSNVFTYNISRAKWTLLGTGHIVENYYIGEEGSVEIYQKDSEKNVFRIMHPLDEMLASAKQSPSWDAAEFNGNEPEYITITVRRDGILEYDDFSSGCDNLNYGAEVWICHPGGFSSTKAETNWTHNTVLSYQDDGETPGQLQLAPWYYMNGVGGWNQSQADGIIVITFPGYTPPYTPDLSSADDFAWEELFEGVFTSAQLGTEGSATLFKGACIAKQNDADQIFAATYGTPYMVESPYAEGYNLYFSINKDGDMKLPEGCDVQPTGLKAMGADVYAKINVGTSSLVGNRLELDITFVNEDGSLTYGKNVEVLEKIVWNQLGIGSYTYSLLYDEPFEQTGMPLYQREDKPQLMKLSAFCAEEEFEGIDLFFTWNQQSNKVIVDEQYTGLDHPNYGSIYVMEAGDYNEQASSGGSYYDPETKTFHFDVIYFVEAGYFGYGYETLTVDLNAAGARMVTASCRPTFAISSVSPFARPSHFVPTATVNHNLPEPLGFVR